MSQKFKRWRRVWRFPIIHQNKNIFIMFYEPWFLIKLSRNKTFQKIRLPYRRTPNQYPVSLLMFLCSSWLMFKKPTISALWSLINSPAFTIDIKYPPHYQPLEFEPSMLKLGFEIQQHASVILVTHSLIENRHFFGYL